LLVGAVKLTDALPLPAVAVPIVGAPGTAAELGAETATERVAAALPEEPFVTVNAMVRLELSPPLVASVAVDRNPTARKTA
jgi:hypothetical protein